MNCGACEHWNCDDPEHLVGHCTLYPMQTTAEVISPCKEIINIMKQVKLDIRDGELKGFKSHDTIKDITCPECGEYMDPDKPCPRCAAQVITLNSGRQTHPVYLRVKDDKEGEMFFPLEYLESFHFEHMTHDSPRYVNIRVMVPPRNYVDYHPRMVPNFDLDKLFSGSVSFTGHIDPKAIAGTIFDPNSKD